MEKAEAAIALCKCGKAHKIYGVRFEKIADHHWKYTWAFPIKESIAKREGYDETIMDGLIEPDDGYPGCPYCGAKYFVICSCGKLNCNIGASELTCEWCGKTSELTKYDGGEIRAGDDR